MAAAATAIIAFAQPGEAPLASQMLCAPPLQERISFSADRNAALQLPDETRHRVRSLLNVERPMKYGEFVWNDRGVPPGDMLVRVDLRAQTMAVFRGGHEIGTAVILYGAEEKPTPSGVYPILEKKEQHRSNLYDAEMPYMLRLTYDGIAIHAADVRAGRATHGCIGIPDAFARALFAVVTPGDRVAVIA